MSSKANCPYCQAPLNVTDTVGAQPAVCPHCLSNLDNPRLAPAAETPNVLRDIRRNATSLSLILTVLSVSCCVAILIFWQIALWSDINRTSIFGLMGSFGVLAVVTLVAAARPVWRCFVGGQQGVTEDGVIAAVVLTVLLAIAIFAFFFTVCTCIGHLANSEIVRG